MKKDPRSKSDSRWEQLLANARLDVGPPADVPSLLRAIRQAEVAPQPQGWAAEFSALILSRRFVPACLTGAGVIAALTTWQVWQWWHALPWAELFLAGGGGA